MRINVRIWISRHLPIFGSLATIDYRAQLEAMYELFLNVIFSTLPLWLGSLIIGINQYSASEANNQDISYYAHFKSAFVSMISTGELLMYATAALGPTLYLGLSYFGSKSKPFPWIRPQLTLSILLTLIASVLFFDSRSSNYASTSLMIYVSTIIYLLSLALLFPAMAFEHEKKRVDPSALQKEDQDDFINGYDRHRSIE